jgi:hypothetical protein
MRHPLLLVASSALLAAACSSTIDVTPTTTTNTNTTNTGGTDTGSGASDVGGAGTGGTGSGGSVSTGGSPTTGLDGGAGGTLLLQAFGGAAGEVAAQVPLLEPGVGQAHTCVAPIAAGACQLNACMLGGIGSPGPGYGNFGPLSATVGATTVALPYTGFGYPTQDFPSTVSLATGGTMTFHGGDGISVPMFDISAVIPGVGVITSPLPAMANAAAIIDTSQDLTVTWLPISIGQIKFALDGGSSQVGGTAVSIACTFGGASGSGVVSRTLLSAMKQMSGASQVYGGLSSELDTTTVIDGLTIETQSFQNSPTGGHDFQVTFQ